MKKKIIILFFSFFVGASLFAQQSKEELQKRQQELKKEIEDLNQSLKSIKDNKSKSLVNYNLVKRKIAAREELIHNINKDLRYLDDNIYLASLEIYRLGKELDTLKRSYAQSLKYAYKNRGNYEYLNFIFSASTFNDAVKRITYLKSYRQFREQQVNNIVKTKELIENKVVTLNDNKVKKSMALQDQNKQLVVLEEDRKEQTEVLNKLKGEEKNIAAQIKKRDQERIQMQNAIAAIIKREAALAAAEAKKKAAEKAAEDERKRKAAIAAQQANNNATSGTASSKPAETVAPKQIIPDEPVSTVASTKNTESTRVYSPFESTDEGKRESINFEGGRGRLPWPVDAGFISIPFGNYTIPNTKLVGKSDGIVISLPAGSNVKAVADGEVSSVFDLGGEQAVLVRHGKYFTTYSHLSTVNVTKDQKVKSGTVLGKAAANEVGEGEVLFMVSNEKGAAQNPELWLKRR